MNKTVIFCCAFLIGAPVFGQKAPAIVPASSAQTQEKTSAQKPSAVADASAKTPAAALQAAVPQAAAPKSPAAVPSTQVKMMEYGKPATQPQATTHTTSHISNPSPAKTPAPKKPMQEKATGVKATTKPAAIQQEVEVDMELVDPPAASKPQDAVKIEPAPLAKPITATEKQTAAAKTAAPSPAPNDTVADKEKPAAPAPAKPTVPAEDAQKSSAPALSAAPPAPVAAVPPAVILLETTAATVPFDNTVPPPATPKPSYSEIAASMALLLELTPEEKSVLESRLALDDKAYDALKKKYDELGTEVAKRRKELLLLREEYDRVTAHSYVAEIINDRLEPDQKEKYRTMLEEEKAARAARLAPPVKIEAPKVEAPKPAPAPVKKEPVKKPLKAKKPKAAAPVKAPAEKKIDEAPAPPDAALLSPGPAAPPAQQPPVKLPSSKSSWRKTPATAKTAPMTGAIPGMNNAAVSDGKPAQ